MAMIQSLYHRFIITCIIFLFDYLKFAACQQLCRKYVQFNFTIKRFFFFFFFQTLTIQHRIPNFISVQNDLARVSMVTTASWHFNLDPVLVQTTAINNININCNDFHQVAVIISDGSFIYIYI